MENANQAFSEYVLERLRYWLSALKNQLCFVAYLGISQSTLYRRRLEYQLVDYSIPATWLQEKDMGAMPGTAVVPLLCWTSIV